MSLAGNEILTERGSLSRLVVLGLLVLGVVAAMQFRADVSRSTWSDYMQDYASARAWRAGSDPYVASRPLIRQYVGRDGRAIPGDLPNPHTPTMIVLLAPLSWLGFDTARGLLLALSAMALMLSLGYLARELGFPWWIGATALLLPVVHDELASGQITCVIALGLVLTWDALQRGRERVAGVTLGVLVALKLFPVLLFVPLLRQRRHRAVGWAAASAIASTVGSAILLGFGPSWRWATTVSPNNVRLWGGVRENASLASWFVRAFGWHMLIAALVLCFCIWAAGRGYWRGTAWAVLASPIVWPHYAVCALPATLVLARKRLALAGAIIVGMCAGVASPHSYAFTTLSLIALGIALARDDHDALGKKETIPESEILAVTDAGPFTLVRAAPNL